MTTTTPLPKRKTRRLEVTLVCRRKIRNHDYSYSIDRERVGTVFEAAEPNLPRGEDGRIASSRWLIVAIDDDGIWGVPVTEAHP